MKKVCCIFGTRPEAIKMAPVVKALQARKDVECKVCVTAQHREMLDQVLEVFGIVPDEDLNIMKPNQSLGELTSRLIDRLDKYLAVEKPDVVLVQGDTTTVLAGALAAFYHKIDIGHVEAGLRTGDLYSPWPEEANRVMTTRLAKWHFAPTEASRDNLLKEGIAADKIFVTGNTVIDALLLAKQKVEGLNGLMVEGLPDFLVGGDPRAPRAVGRDDHIAPRMVLITGHRRENFGDGFEQICHAIAKCAAEFPDVHFVYPVHLNPNVQEPVARILGKKVEYIHCSPSPSTFTSNSNIHLIKPLGYLPFVALMNRAYLILTDSGGVQEEAPSIGKPVLVMRNTTERPEAVTAGGVRLVGANAENIYAGVKELLTNEAVYNAMAKSRSPYGDGKAAERIVEIVCK